MFQNRTKNVTLLAIPQHFVQVRADNVRFCSGVIQKM
jgi:hypothetical protein